MKRTVHESLPLLALLLISLGLLGACGDGEGTSPPPPAATGSVEATTATAGQSIDADGYVLAVDGGAGQAIGVNATVTMDDVEVGSRSVELGDVAPNCAVSGDNPRTLSVTDGGVATTAFAVTCTGLGSVEITTTTSGGAIDPDGYAVSIAGGTGQAVGVNASLTVDGVPAGPRSVALTGVADNCTVAGENPREVAVPVDATVSTQFDVTCIAPISGQIVFATDRDGDSEIYVMDEDGTNPVRLTNRPGFDASPTVSPDGTRIAFSFVDTQLDIYVMNADGSEQVALANGPTHEYGPTWSPDGSRIAFGSGQSGSYQIWVMDADGSNLTKLTNTTVPNPINQEPAWSPNGSQIAFTSTGYEIWVMDEDGSNLTNLTDHPAGASFSPAWSPDGSQIAFTSTRDADTEIYVMNADGSGQKNLTNSPGLDTDPAWSPDGSRLLFMSQRDGNDEIYVMNADGSGQVNLTNSPASNEHPGGPRAWR